MCGYCWNCQWFKLSDAERKEMRREMRERHRKAVEEAQRKSHEVTSELIELLKVRDVGTFVTKFHENYVHIDHDRLTSFFWEKPDHIMFEKLVSRGIRICRSSSQLPPLNWIVNLFVEMFEKGLIKAQWFVFTDFFFDQLNYFAATAYTTKLLELALDAGETELILALLKATSLHQHLTHRIYKLFLTKHRFVETGDLPTVRIRAFLLNLFPTQVGEVDTFIEKECHGMNQAQEESVEEILPKKEIRKKAKIPKPVTASKGFGKAPSMNFARSIQEDYELYCETY